jgi:uncharacterized protein
MGIALVTGASSGLGKAYARQLDVDHRVDEIWLVARRRERLEELVSTLTTPARILEYDLRAPESIEDIGNILSAESLPVTYLINAAGYGKFGRYDEVSLSDGEGMVDLNCRACVDLAITCLPYMTRGSRMLNIVSCAGFLPLQGLNIYAASKAFMLSYSRALRWEVASRGIVVTAVCPAWMKTEFMAVGKKDVVKQPTVKHFPFAQRPETVVRRSLLANRIGFATATCGIPAFFLRIVAKFLPNFIPMAGWAIIRRL